MRGLWSHLEGEWSFLLLEGGSVVGRLGLHVGGMVPQRVSTISRRSPPSPSFARHSGVPHKQRQHQVCTVYTSESFRLCS